MANDRDRQISIDPLFALPENVIDVTQEYESAEPEEGIEGFVEEDIEFVTFDPVDGTMSDSPVVPTSFTIVRQRVFIGRDGSSRTDVYIEFPDADMAQDVEIKVTPV